MKKSFFQLVLVMSFALLTMSCSVAESAAEQSESVVSLSGNAYITASPEGKHAFIDEGRSAIRNWNDQETVVSFYFRAMNKGKMTVSLQAMGHSQVEVSLLGETEEVELASDTLTLVEVGTFKVKEPGYVKVDIRGKKINAGDSFGNVASLVVKGNVGPVVCVNGDFSTHFGRRGPSTHMSYTLPEGEVEWFYNEVVVPEEGDIPSSYYMACGFGEGYFGMQNNTPYPRRILFSVWSPFVTDNPAEIPDSMRVQLVRKGAETTINDFGNEGSGGQSYMHYDWKPGERCRFLMGVRPDKNNTTVYTAYFYDNHQNKWSLVASWRRPQITTWYTHAYSFLENFNPVMGHITRKAYYCNQWARTADGKWLPVTQGRFTCDATGNQKQRLDYKGGVENNDFFLTMGGFFNDFLESGTPFTREGNVTEAPDVDFSTLE